MRLDCYIETIQHTFIRYVYRIYLSMMLVTIVPSAAYFEILSYFETFH